MVTWVVFLSLGLLVGMAAGVYFGQMDIFKRRQREELQARLEKAESELSRYKMDVTEHFLVTASLVNAMTESYQAVHEHLAKGANRLCDSTVNVNRLNVASGQHLEDLQVRRADRQVRPVTDAGHIYTAKDGEFEDLDALDNSSENPESGSVELKSASENTTANTRPRTPNGRNTTARNPAPTSADVSSTTDATSKKGSVVAAHSDDDVAPEPTGVKPQETVADLLAAEAAKAGNPDAGTEKAVKPAVVKPSEVVEPPSTPESLSFDEEESNRTVH